MKYAHNIELRVFIKQEDNEEGIMKNIHDLLPFDFEKEKVEQKIDHVSTLDETPFNIVTIFNSGGNITTLCHNSLIY